MSKILLSLSKLMKYKAQKNNNFELLENKSAKVVDSKDSKSTNDLISKDLSANLSKFQEEFKMDKNSDIIIRKLKIAEKTNSFLVFVDGMVDRNTINNYILKPIMNPDVKDISYQDNLIDYLQDTLIAIHDIRVLNNYEEIFMQILNGLTALFVDGYDKSLIFETRGYEKRNVEKPVTETVTTGSQEGFSEI